MTFPAVVIRTISSPNIVIHTALSGPAAIPLKKCLPSAKVVIFPVVVIRTTQLWELWWLLNHSAPSGPSMIPVGFEMPRPLKSVTFPLVVIRPIVLLPPLVNHSARSGPAVIPAGKEIPRRLKMVAFPRTVIRPIESLPLVNHSAPSGPTVRLCGVSDAGRRRSRSRRRR